MSSGINVNDECKAAYLELKSGHKFKTIFYEINSTQTEIVVKEKFEEQSYAELTNLLIHSYPLEPLYIVHDFHYDTDDRRHKEDVIFISWCPEDAQIKKKMVHTSSKDALKKVCGGLKVEVQANDKDDLEESNVLQKVKSH